jgi:hypothetical protein
MSQFLSTNSRIARWGMTARFSQHLDKAASQSGGDEAKQPHRGHALALITMLSNRGGSLI